MRDEKLDGVGGGDLAGKIIKQRLPVRESDRSNSLSASVLKVLSMLDMVIFDVIDEGFKCVEIALFGAVSGFDGAREGIIGGETKLVVDSNDFVELASNGEVSES